MILGVSVQCAQGWEGQLLARPGAQAAETLLLLSLLCDPSLPLFSSPVLASAPALPATPIFGVALDNFESWTERESPTEASSSAFFTADD